MGIFKKKNTAVEEQDELRGLGEPAESLTLFAMASSEPVKLDKEADKTSTYSWSKEFSRLSDQEKREVVIFKEQLSEHFIRHKNKYYLKITDINPSDDDEKDKDSDPLL